MIWSDFYKNNYNIYLWLQSIWYNRRSIKYGRTQTRLIPLAIWKRGIRVEGGKGTRGKKKNKWKMKESVHDKNYMGAPVSFMGNHVCEGDINKWWWDGPQNINSFYFRVVRFFLTRWNVFKNNFYFIFLIGIIGNMYHHMNYLHNQKKIHWEGNMKSLMPGNVCPQRRHKQGDEVVKLI